MSSIRSTPGPIAWCGIIVSTCLLLLLFQKVLWLVVPFLLALILYYLLAPPAKRLVMAGFSNDFAAIALSGAFLLLLTGCLLLLYPWTMTKADDWQEIVQHYLASGSSVLEAMLVNLQQKFAFLEKAHVADELHWRMQDISSHFADKYLGTFLLWLAAWLPSLLLTPIITFFMLKDGVRLRKFVGSVVPNAYFEKTLYLMHAVNRTARTYFVGLMKLTLIDALTLAFGLWMLGISSPLLLGAITAVLSWIPYLGPLLGCAMVVMVTATDFPGNSTLIYGAIGLFLLVRALDDFVFMPYIVGRSLHLHPLLTVLMFFVGEAIAGVAGLMLVIPILGVVAVLGETLELIFTDTRLGARHAYALKLRTLAANSDL